jgi:hypothetical protein
LTPSTPSLTPPPTDTDPTTTVADGNAFALAMAGLLFAAISVMMLRHPAKRRR